MVGVSSAVTDEEFLLCCIEHAKNVKIDFAAVAKDLGYASDKVAGNRMRAIKKKIEAKKSETNDSPSVKDEPAPDKTLEKDDEPEHKPKRRGRKRKSEVIAKEEE
ncbi:hypothetical protein AA313_de0210453 [Arthrobotrys entomopaga]|nr:hypothetical protein AA313_de0210453 [Arthrobotrys entomopaga]